MKIRAFRNEWSGVKARGIGLAIRYVENHYNENVIYAIWLDLVLFHIRIEWGK